MINCNEKENENGKKDNINKTYRPRRRHETNIDDIASIGNAMSLCNKQHLSNI